MIRAAIIALAVLCTAATPLAAGEAPHPDAAAAAARAQAEAALAQARTRIAAEQAQALRALEAATREADAQRERAGQALAAAEAAAADLARRRREQERELTTLRQLADRAVVAAKLGQRATRELAAKPPAERVEAAIAGALRRAEALPAQLGARVADEAVVGRDGAVATVRVLRLGEARAVALGTTPATRGLLQRAGDGSSWLVAGPAIPAQADAGTLALIPVDAAGTAAQRPGEVHRTFRDWLAAGRFFIWPILATLVVGLGIALLRGISLARRRVDPGRTAEVAVMLARGEPGAARAAVSTGRTPLDRVLRAGLDAAERPRAAREALIEQAVLAEQGELARGISALAVLAGVAPLLGLLGTVTGMIDMFAVIAAEGSGNARSLSGGISEALVCTQAGMIAAIPLLLLHALLARLADRGGQRLEEAACAVMGLTADARGSGRDEPQEALA